MKQNAITPLMLGVLIMGTSTSLSAQRVKFKPIEISKNVVTRNVTRVTRPDLSKMKNFNPAFGARGFAMLPTRNVREFNPLFGYGKYNPVLGYKTQTSMANFSRFHELTTRPATAENRNIPVQFAPKVTQGEPLSNLVAPFEELTVAQLTEFLYMWRLANPDVMVNKSSSLYKMAQQQIQELQTKAEKYHGEERFFAEYPNVLFLQRLLDPAFTPKTYTQLVLETSVYPKHVTLNQVGFPVPTPQAAQARLLDNYLMLSHPRIMWLLDSTAGTDAYGSPRYTPLVQTFEEHVAAEYLLEMRQASVRIGQEATPRQLLEIAYNELESRTIPYSLTQDNVWTYDPIPYYNRTQLGKAIEQTLAQSARSAVRESRDISHLRVLHAVMNGLDTEYTDELNATMDSFEKLCKETPSTPENVAHLKQLHASLLNSDGFWQYLKIKEYDSVEFGELSEEEVAITRERISRFANQSVDELMQVK